jgi:hypothetical protein
MILSVEIKPDAYATKFARFSWGPVEFCLQAELADYLEVAKACRDGVDWRKGGSKGEWCEMSIKNNKITFSMETTMSTYMELTLPTSDCVAALEQVCKELA